MDDVQSAIVEVVAEVSQLGVKLDKVEADVEAALSRGDKDEVVALRRKEEQLRTKEEELRKEKRQLQEEVSLLPPLSVHLGRLSVTHDTSGDICARLLLPVLEALPLLSALPSFLAVRRQYLFLCTTG